VDGHVVVHLGRVLWVEVNVGRRLALVGHSLCLELEQGWPPCDADYEKNSKMIRNHAELSVRINK
jgi:hypothetical protein